MINDGSPTPNCSGKSFHKSAFDESNEAYESSSTGGADEDDEPEAPPYDPAPFVKSFEGPLDQADWKEEAGAKLY